MPIDHRQGLVAEGSSWVALIALIHDTNAAPYLQELKGAHIEVNAPREHRVWDER